MAPNAYVVLDKSGLSRVVTALREGGRSVVGPRLGDGAIVYDTIESTDDLPSGWTDEQGPGNYRLRRRNDQAWFGYVVGPQSWKRFLHPPRVTLFRLERTDDGFTPRVPAAEGGYAFIGVRPCELAAIAVQDRVFLEGPFVDAGYAARRADVFVVAVNCAQAGETCFCASMGTGPRAREGFDLALTEVIEGESHRFVVEVGSEAGRTILAGLPHRPASEVEAAEALAISAATAASMGRRLDTDGLKEALYESTDHPQWDDVARRCLACTNCTMVCPTCFCTSVKEVSDLAGGSEERVRLWDSCFTTEFSYIHGGPVRSSIKARYRQWLTHKLATWIDQFGTSGCVGCGRCITWCPVGIDLTAEVRALRTAAAVPAHEGS
jgi:ferredoxin